MFCVIFYIFRRNVALTQLIWPCEGCWLHSTHQLSKSNLIPVKHSPQILSAVELVQPVREKIA